MGIYKCIYIYYYFLTNYHEILRHKHKIRTFVHDDDLALAQKSSPNAQELLLPDRKVLAPLRDERIQLQRQGLDIIVQIDATQRLPVM